MGIKILPPLNKLPITSDGMMKMIELNTNVPKKVLKYETLHEHA